MKKSEMDFQKLYDFLRELNTSDNNDKSWMDDHRDGYEEVRDSYISFLDDLNSYFKQTDPNYQDTTGRRAINRINNNKMFHPEKPTYKDHFGASLDKAENKAEFYIHLGINTSFVACGFYHVPNDKLKLIRQEIDYNGSELEKILNHQDFKKTFGGLWTGDSLKTSPKGYSSDHPRIEWIRLKSFVVQKDFTEHEVVNGGFKEQLIQLYELMLPFRRFLDMAVDEPA
ncbi:MAG: DUF2461 domain-containing protein [Cyclobacteriaceae bacterium]